MEAWASIGLWYVGGAFLIAAVASPVVFLVWLWLGLPAPRFRPGVVPSFAATSAITLVVLTVLVVTEVPLRIGYAWARDDLENVASTLRRGLEIEEPLRCGPYRIRDAALGDSGSVYLRVTTHPDWIDVISHGFAHDPDARGTPFGAADYVTRDLGDGWCTFRVSDDW